MTNEEMIQDLKQFIAATVSQSEDRINDRLGGRLDNVENRLSDLEAKIDTIQDHGQRLTRLEQRAA